MGIRHELQPSRPEEPGRGSSGNAAVPSLNSLSEPPDGAHPTTPRFWTSSS